MGMTVSIAGPLVDIVQGLHVQPLCTGLPQRTQKTKQNRRKQQTLLLLWSLKPRNSLWATNSPWRGVLQRIATRLQKSAASKTLRVVGALPVHCLQLDCALREFEATGLTPAQRRRRRLLESNQVDLYIIAQYKNFNSQGKRSQNLHHG